MKDLLTVLGINVALTFIFGSVAMLSLAGGSFFLIFGGIPILLSSIGTVCYYRGKK